MMNIIIAVAKNNVIGKDGKIPWHFKEDFQYFKRTTMGRPIVMGRKTYESIGKPLPGRTNIVVNRGGFTAPESVVVCSSFEQAYATARPACQDFFVIGGAALYEDAMQWAGRIYLTQVDLEVEGDTFFPKIIPWQWSTISMVQGEDPKLSFHILERVTR